VILQINKEVIILNNISCIAEVLKKPTMFDHVDKSKRKEINQ